MGISIVVRRGDGLHVGESIIDPLIVTIAVALARGRNELDERASGLQGVDLEIPFRQGLRLGQLIEVTETLFGQVWYGKVTGLSHSYSNTEAVTTVRLVRPTDFFI